MLSAEQVEKNFYQYRTLFEKTGERAPQALHMVDSLGERLALCPASARKDYHNAFPGGLIEHSLRVLQSALSLCKAFNWKVPKESLIIGALFHDVGKVGNHEMDYYIPQTDQYRKDRYGELYTFNDKLPYMSVPLRGVFLCQHYGLRLTEEETLAIYLNDGFVIPENKPYCLKEPLLAHVIMTADYISTRREKGAFGGVERTQTEGESNT
jgi:putative nucleotidyltransferase with HDIG domain